MAQNDELSAALEALRLDKEGTQAEGQLDAILKTLDQDDIQPVTVVPPFVEKGILTELCRFLSIDACNHAKVAQVIAELAKVESIRVQCVEAGLVGPLLDLMLTRHIANVTQACRALGNICFDNDRGRDAVDERGGVQNLLAVMKNFLGKTEEGSNKLRIVACGFLLNLTNTHGLHLSSCNVQQPFGVHKVVPSSPDESDNVRMITLRLKLNPNTSQESLQERAISLGAMELLDEYLQVHGSDTGTAQMALLTVGTLADSEAGRDHLSECQVAVTVGSLLAADISRDLQDTILDLLATLAESDEVKVQLAKSDLKHHLIRMTRACEGNSDEDTGTLEKLTSDLIVLLLSGDPSMDILYEEGEGVVFKETVAWLKAPSEQLQMSGALAVGNFARNEPHCLHLVSNGITTQLLDQLRRDPAEVHPTLQHAVFSALRNLAIPAANKSLMLQCGLLDVVLRYVNTDMTAVQFKLLGLLRMVIDKQEDAATTLGTRDIFIQRLMQWCVVEDHAGVKGEANRLSAWIVKHSRKSSVMRNITRHGGVPHLVNMANAEHAVMQNEALVALALIATSILGDAVSSFVSADLVPTIIVLLTDDDSLPEILSNVLTLIRALTPSEELLTLLQAADVAASVRGLEKHGDAMVQARAKDTAAIFDKG